jgi:hypothetical protein
MPACAPLSSTANCLGQGMNRFAVFAVVLGSVVLSSWAADGSVGASSNCENARCVVSASSSPISILLSVALVLFVVTYPQRTSASDETRVVGVWRRFGAFFLDFASVVMVVSSLGAVPVLVAEAGFTGAFQWTFERDFARPTDTAYVLPAALGAFLLLFLYFYLHARVNRQTIGQYVLGYRVSVASAAAKPRHGVRVLLAFVGLCMWPISVILALMTLRKAFWWDLATNSRVVRVGS